MHLIVSVLLSGSLFTNSDILASFLKPMAPTTDITLSCENQLHQTFFLFGSCPALLQLSLRSAFFAVQLSQYFFSSNCHDQFSSLVATAISKHFFTLQRLSCNTCHALKSIVKFCYCILC